MNKQSRKKHEFLGNSVPAVRLKSESYDSGQPKNKSAQDVSEKSEKKLEISKARNQKKSKRTSRDAEIRETKTSAAKIESARNSTHSAANLPFINNVLKRSVRLPLTTPRVRG